MWVTCATGPYNWICLCSPFYRQKSESANPPTGVLPLTADVYEESTRTNVDGLIRTPLDRHRGWSDVDRLSSVTESAATEVIAAVESATYGQLTVPSSSQQTVSTNSNSWTSSPAATAVPNNGLLLQQFSIYHYMNGCYIVNGYCTPPSGGVVIMYYAKGSEFVCTLWVKKNCTNLFLQ